LREYAAFYRKIYNISGLHDGQPVTVTPMTQQQPTVKAGPVPAGEVAGRKLGGLFQKNKVAGAIDTKKPQQTAQQQATLADEVEVVIVDPDSTAQKTTTGPIANKSTIIGVDKLKDILTRSGAKVES
jgi:hypothetical protein